MSDFIERVRDLLCAGDVQISEHGYDELAEDGLTAREVIADVMEAVVVEEYPNYAKGPCILLLQKIERVNLFMLYGVSRKVLTSLWFWSRHTGRTLSGGMKRLRGGGNDETAKKVKVCA